MDAIRHPIKRSFVFFLVPDFTMVAFATALDPLRLANRMLGYDAYNWRLASHDGRPVKASNGVECAVDTSLEDERRKMAGPERPSMVIVCSGINVETYNNRSVFAWMREEYNRGVAVGGLCTGAYVLAAAPGSVRADAGHRFQSGKVRISKPVRQIAERSITR